jgi:hypothetical protein
MMTEREEQLSRLLAQSQEALSHLQQENGKRPMWCLLTEFSRVIVFVRDFCSDVYAALAEGRRDLAQASGVMAGI